MQGGYSFRQRRFDIWPGFVDALASILLITVFVLLILVMGQQALSVTISGKDSAMRLLEQRIGELSSSLSLSEGKQQDLQQQLAQLTASLSFVEQEKAQVEQDLQRQLAQLTSSLSLVELEKTQLEQEKVQVEQDLQRQLAQLTASLSFVEQEKAQVEQNLQRRLAQLTSSLSLVELEKTQVEQEKAQVEQDLQRRLAQLTSSLSLVELEKMQVEQEKAQVEQDLQRRLAQLTSSLSLVELEKAQVEQEKVQALSGLQEAEGTADSLRRQARQTAEHARSETKRAEELEQDNLRISTQARQRIETLTSRIEALHAQLRGLETLLAESEERAREGDVRITNLSKRLNAALAEKVQELQSYRSEFFGRLREVLGRRADVEIVGDRFVLQSELLFASGSAYLGEKGRQQLLKIARTLNEIAALVPPQVAWVLRVDGHTDGRPIHNMIYRSNWELSTARALAVVHFLIENGIPPDRLAASGFGEYHPLEQQDALPDGSYLQEREDSQEAVWARNRRIEFKFTQR